MIRTINELIAINEDVVRISGSEEDDLFYLETLIPNAVDVLVTHEPPVMILDRSAGVHWGNAFLRSRVFEVCPRYHLFGHVHESYGILHKSATTFSNASLLDDAHRLVHPLRLLELE